MFENNNEGEKIRYIYIIDEAHYIGKGGNTVINMFDDFLNSAFPLDEIIFFCDNTVGQNKNNTLMHY